MDAQQRRLKLFEALRAMMLQGGQRPLVLAVEDLHWIDKTSEEVLLHLADSIPAARVLLLVTYRPGYQNPFGERTYTTRIGLRTLSDHDSLRLAAGMLAMADFLQSCATSSSARRKAIPSSWRRCSNRSWRWGHSGSATATTCSRSPSLRSTSPILSRM